jgi:predicted RNase H-like HicB family nuclease
MAVEMAGRIELEAAPAGAADEGTRLNAFAIFDGTHWASLCPELDIASVGATSQEAIENVIEAVEEAIAFANEHGLQAGHPVPPDAMREFLISSQAPYAGRNFVI